MAETKPTTRRRKTRKPPAPLDGGSPLSPPSSSSTALSPVDPTQTSAIDFARASQTRLGAPTRVDLPETQQYIPSDFAADSSTLQPTPDAEAEKVLKTIKEKQNTAAVIQENLKLTNALLKAHGSQGQVLQNVAKVATEFEKISPELLKHQQAIESAATEQVKLQHKQTEREGLEAMTALIQARIEAQQQQARARIAKIEAATAKLQERSPLELGSAPEHTLDIDV